jgi:hypothetical protein
MPLGLPAFGSRTLIGLSPNWLPWTTEDLTPYAGSSVDPDHVKLTWNAVQQVYLFRFATANVSL